MKRFYQIYIFIGFIIICNSLSAQNFVPFTPRFNQDVKGDMLIIGNNILNRDTSTTNPNDAYNGTAQNMSFDMQFIDIDNDATTFNSSSADLDIASVNCYKIAYAGLYWGAILQSGSRTDINKVKFKLPIGDYIDITGQTVYDANLTPIGVGNKPYACFADVTNLLSPLVNPEGTYTLANVISSIGSNAGTGLSAGWTLFIVYEDLALTKKSITSFDGFSGITGTTSLDIPINGFRTIPVGPIKSKFAFSVLEGDLGIIGDYLKINGTTISTSQRPANNFFNSTLTTTTGLYTARNPNSGNTLGTDAGIININNPSNIVISNNSTSATIRIGDNSDTYFYYFNAFANEIIEPNIYLRTTVNNISGMDIGGSNVNLAQDIIYEIRFQNVGNDDASNFTISTIIPVNVIFNPANLILPPGVTYNYNNSTREIIFTIPNNLINVGDPMQVIRINVQVSPNCSDFVNSCSNHISTQAFATYQGVINTNQITNDPSTASFSLCNNLPASTTDVLVDNSSCSFTATQALCAVSDITLTAANGYASYVWSGPAPSTATIGTTQSIVVTEIGNYTVNDIAAAAPCNSIQETFVVNSCFPSNIVTQNASRLFAQENNAIYQWIDCDNSNSSISGEVNQNFYPTASGNYAVIITNLGGYQVTSACTSFTFLNTNNFQKNNFKVYPNPTNNIFKVQTDYKIEKVSIYNLLGQKIALFSGNSNEYSIEKLEVGTYIIEIESEKGKNISRILKN